MDILYNIIAVKYSSRPEISRTILDGRPSLSLTQKLLQYIISVLLLCLTVPFSHSLQSVLPLPPTKPAIAVLCL